MSKRTKALKTLIKMKQQTLDDIRRDLMMQQGAFDETESSINRLKQQMSQERYLVSTDPEYYQSLGQYLANAEHQVDLYNYQLTQISKDLEATRERMGEAFQEFKRYEIALEAHKRKEKEAEELHERKTMDEIGARKKVG